MPDPAHVPLDRALGHAKVELEQFPRIRSAPQSRLFVAMVSMRAIVSAPIRGGAPVRLDFRRQKRWKACRCQRRMVSGWTRSVALRQVGERRARSTSIPRSARVNRGRAICRQATSSCLRKSAFSRARFARERKWSHMYPGRGRVDGRVQRRIRSRSEARVRAGRDIRCMGIAALSAHPARGSTGPSNDGTHGRPHRIAAVANTPTWLGHSASRRSGD